MQRVNNLIPEIIFTTAQEATDPGGDLIRVGQTLNKLKLVWYLAFGSALGFYRDKDFVKGDTDIDIAVLGDYGEKVIEAMPSEYKLIRTVTVDGVLHQTAFQKEDRFIIDICYFQSLGGIYQSFCEGGRWVDDRKVIGCPVDYPTKYGYFPMPEKIEEYLTARYGDWKTPKYGAITSSIKA